MAEDRTAIFGAPFPTAFWHFWHHDALAFALAQLARERAIVLSLSVESPPLVYIVHKRMSFHVLKLARDAQPALLPALAVVFSAETAGALDLQGKGAHEGKPLADEDAAQGHDFDVSGHLDYGVSLYNPTYGARPDNSGLALFRYAGHADLDLIGRRLSIPLDVDVFTDGTQPGARIFVPSELDVIVGITSSFGAGPGDFEIGSRFEHDSPVDRGGFNQGSFDTRLRYLYSLKRAWPALERALGGGNVEGWFTLGWFAGNLSYPARPDNTGLALLRYQARTEVSCLGEHAALGIDFAMFTNRTSSDPVGPSELDFTSEIISRWRPFEFHLAYERDVPVDRGGFTETFIYFLAEWEFDLRGRAPPEPERSEPTSRRQ